MRLLKLASAFIIAAALAIGVAPAAHAAPQSYCPSGATCLWQNHTYKTNGSESAYLSFQQCINTTNGLKYRGTNTNVAQPISVYNNGNYDTVSVYANSGYGIAGPTESLFRRQLAKKTGDGNVTNNEGLIASFSPIQSAKFNTVPSTCVN